MAEDDLRVAALLEQLLSESGCEPTVHHDGRAALRDARRGGFDVLLLDWMLPDRVARRSSLRYARTATRRLR